MRLYFQKESLMKKLLIGLLLLETVVIVSIFSGSIKEQGMKNCAFLSGALSALDGIIGKEDACRATIQTARDRYKIDIDKDTENTICTPSKKKEPQMPEESIPDFGNWPNHEDKITF